MINPRKQSFIERLTGTVDVNEQFDGSMGQEELIEHIPTEQRQSQARPRYQERQREEIPEEEDEEGQLAVDVYETDNEIIIQSMIAGVTPEHLNVSITRDMVVIRGRRVSPEGITDDQYAVRELFWGSFAREIELPCEIDTEGAEAVEKYGLLIIRLPKIDAHRTQKLVVKSI